MWRFVVGLLSVSGLALCSCSSDASSSSSACALLSPSQASAVLGSQASAGPDCTFFGKGGSLLSVSEYPAPGLPSQAASYPRVNVDGVAAVWIPAGSPAPGGGVTTTATLDYAHAGHVVSISLTGGDNPEARVERTMAFMLGLRQF